MENNLCTEQEQFLLAFKNIFDDTIPEEQFKILQSFISTSDGYLKWRVKAWLSSESTPDLLSLLPPEIQLKILKYIDGSSLVRASQVSKAWNIILKNHKQLWKIKSKELGVNVEEKPPDISWNAAFFSSWKQLHYLGKGTAFKEKFIDLQNCKKSVKAIDYHQGYVCAVSDEDRITIWHLELNCPMLSFMAIPAVSCIKFKPNSTLVCGHFTGILSSWDLRAMSQCKQYPSRLRFINEDRYYSEFCLLDMKFSMHSGPVFSCDFSKDLQLLVSGSADEMIKFWCLQTGQLLHNLDIQNHWILKVILIPACINSSVNSLITMTRESVDKFDWTCKGMDICKESDILYKRGNFSNIVLASKIKLNQNNDNFITPGLQMSSKYVGLVKQDLQEKQAILVILHANNFLPCKETPLNFKVRKLLAIGNRFALLLTVGKVLYTSTLVIVDIISDKIVGTYIIPHSKMTTPDGAQIIVGDTRWLDGLSGWDKVANLPITTHSQKPWDDSIGCDIDNTVVSCSGSLEDLCQKYKEFNIGLDGSDELHYHSLNSFNRVSKEMSNLVLAAGIKDHVGRIFTLWWKGDEQEKKKVD